MWRRNYEEDWERKRQYIIRSLFHDMPLLSPVTEEEESIDSIRSHICRSPPDATERPYSPLPPLNIEIQRIPNRHDEPEEFYKKLEKKMRQVYRKLFIEGRSDINTSLDGYEEEDELDLQSIGNIRNSFDDVNVDTTVDIQNSSNEVRSSENKGQKRVHKNSIEDDLTTNGSSESKNSKSMIDDLVDLDNNSNTDNAPENISSQTYNARSSTPNETANNEKSSLTEYSTDCRQVTFKADVHRENEDGVLKPRVVHEVIIDDLEAGVENLEILEKKIDSDSSNQSSRESAAPQEIELMRTPRVHPSTGSLHPVHDDSYNYEDIAVEQRPRVLEALTESSSLDERDSNSVDLEVNFELQSRVSDRSKDSAVLGSSRKRSSRHSSASNKRTRYEDVGLQTSLDYDEENDNLNGIFVGVPTVYRICSCVDHTCDC